MRRQIEEEFAQKLERQAKILEEHYNQQLEKVAEGSRDTAQRALETAMTERYGKLVFFF